MFIFYNLEFCRRQISQLPDKIKQNTLDIHESVVSLQERFD